MGTLLAYSLSSNERPYPIRRASVLITVAGSCKETQHAPHTPRKRAHHVEGRCKDAQHHLGALALSASWSTTHVARRCKDAKYHLAALVLFARCCATQESSDRPKKREVIQTCVAQAVKNKNFTVNGQ